MNTTIKEHVDDYLVVGPRADIIRELCNRLNQSKVSYCHWKSNVNLERAVSGETDLDLLVDREDEPAFLVILNDLGFKKTIECKKYDIPGITNYYGYDRNTGLLVHVHAHYQLILGHDATKNYHIPVEVPYIKSASLNGFIMVPSAEFELIIFVIRMMLKHSTWDVILLGQRKLNQSEKGELDYLLGRTSSSKISEVLNQHFPYINRSLFDACLESIRSNPSISHQILTGQKIVKCLHPFARRPGIIDNILKLWRRVLWPIQKRIIHQDDRKQMSNGGIIIAIIGGDGAGKTTVVEELYKWLSCEIQVSRFHMGKPKWTFLSFLIHAILKIGRVIGLYPFMKAEVLYTTDTSLIVFPGYPWLIREICTARDRLMTYKTAKKIAASGKIVICDRFPLPQIKFMDGPQVSRMTVNLRQTKLLKYLIHLEESYYSKITPPDILVLLRVDPSIACHRKTTEIEEEVFNRSKEMWEIDWRQTPAIVIDANRSSGEVLSEIKELVWSRL